MDHSLADERMSYDAEGLLDSAASGDPWELFRAWLRAAQLDDAVPEPTAMVLSTAAVENEVIVPKSRIVLCKDVDERGITFYTNRESAKGCEIAANAWVSLLFWWQPHFRQVRIEGPAVPVDDAESDAYFATRPRGSQLGAHASQQSRPIASRQALHEADAQVAARFEGREVPRPPHWGGYRVAPELIEFWQGQPNRLHDRIRFTRADDGWTHARLQP